jgi:hypothetical protein
MEFILDLTLVGTWSSLVECELEVTRTLKSHRFRPQLMHRAKRSSIHRFEFELGVAKR